MTRQSIYLLTRLLAELAILLAFYAVGRQLVLWFNLSIPPGVVGLALLLAVFAFGWLSPEQLQRGAALLMGEMLLFFIPAVMSLLDQGTLIKNQGWKIILIIIISTVLVMLGTAITVELVYRWSLMRRWRKKHDH